MARSEAKPGKRLQLAFEVLDDVTFAITRWVWGAVREIESRVFHSAAASLPRVFGHVFHKIDCKSFPEISDGVSKRCMRRKPGQHDDQIFTGSIEVERNSILNEYSSGWTPVIESPIYLESPGPKEIEDCSNSPEGFEAAFESAADDKHVVAAFGAIQMPDGPFAGCFLDGLFSEQQIGGIANCRKLKGW